MADCIKKTKENQKREATYMALLSNEDIETAKSCSLTRLAAYMGYSVKKVGNLFTLNEMDSIRIYNDRTWYRFSERGNRTGGSIIDFYMEFSGEDNFQNAVNAILNLNGLTKQQPGGSPAHSFTKTKKAPEPKAAEKPEATKKEFVLPKAADSYKRAYAYLMKTRGLSLQVINYFVKELKLLYEEDSHHNIVFIGKDHEGNAKYAALRGTMDLYGKKFKGDVYGSDKDFGVNIVNLNDSELKVFESTIDMMSYMDITGDYHSNKIAVGMLSDNSLNRFLEYYKHIKEISFCIDGDLPAKNALYGKEQPDGKTSVGLLEKYKRLGYKTSDESAPYNSKNKDYNDTLKDLKENYGFTYAPPDFGLSRAKRRRGPAR